MKSPLSIWNYSTNRFVRFVLALTLLVPASFAQSGRRTAPVQDDEVIKIHSDEVLLPVSVRDSSERMVPGLLPEDFFIYDNGVRQDITSFNRRRVPANIVLLLDASGSVFSQMHFIREAAKTFVEALLPEDQVSVMQFADRVDVLQDWIQASNMRAAEKALDWRYHPGNLTRFYGGLYQAAENQLKKVEGRKIVILLTDGIDTDPNAAPNFETALNAVKHAEASVYVVSLTASLRAALKEGTGNWLSNLLSGGYDRRIIRQYMGIIDKSEDQLRSLATETGGRIFLPVEKKDLAPAYGAIAEELRTQYIITYKPKPLPRPGEWRNIRVLVSPGGYDVAAREGYLGRA